MEHPARLIRAAAKQHPAPAQGQQQHGSCAHLPPPKRRESDQQQQKQRRKLGSLADLLFVIAVQQGLGGIGLNLHAIHKLGVVNGGEVAVLEPRRAGADEDDLSAEQAGQPVAGQQVHR